jgi:polysaccharide pyruvyl transferase CsaB
MQVAADPTQRILIGGYYGFGNTGDEIILSVLLRELRAIDSNLVPVVVSGNPQITMDIHNVTAIHWQDWEEILSTARDSRAIILGGGGLFEDYFQFDPESLFATTHHGLAYYISFPLLAALLGKPAMLYAVGVGPLFTEEGRLFTRSAFEHTPIVTVRDADSKTQMVGLGIDETCIQVTSDPAFQFIPVSNPQLQRILEKENIPQGNGCLLGIALRKWDVGVQSGAWLQTVAAAIDRFLLDHDGYAIAIPFQESQLYNDTQTAVILRASLRHPERLIALNGQYSPVEKASLLSACSIVLGMRLHSVILASVSKVPCVALAYDPKVSKAMETLGMSKYCIGLSELNDQLLLNSLEQAYVNREQISTDLKQRIPVQQALSRKNGFLLGDLVRMQASPSTQLGPSSSAIFKRAFLRIFERALILPKTDHQNAELVQLLGAVREELSATKTASQSQIESIELERDSIKQDLRTLHLEYNQLHYKFQTILDSKTWRIAIRTRHRLYGMLRIPRAIYRLITPTSVRRRIWLIRRNSTLVRSTAAKPSPAMFSYRSVAMPTTTSTPMLRHERKLGTVNIVTPTFFNFQGNDMFFGGAERYLIELCSMLHSRGYIVRVYQCATDRWVRFYRHVQVFGINANGNIDVLNQHYHQEIEAAEFTIYFAFFLAASSYHSNNLGISHGIYWDNAAFQSHDRISQQIDKIKTAIKNCDRLVSVDTNTINWVRASFLSQSAKFTYIPNFVDTQTFAPSEVREESPEKIVILYPRRLYTPRGFWLVVDCLAYFLEKYPQVQFDFVGKGNPSEIDHLEKLQATYPRRIRHYNLPPERMSEAYRTVDITLIPTLASEGTSLSCLEAMASGNAVIATNVGGLPNLIIDGYNGLLIEPTSLALKTALERLLTSPETRNRLRERARETSLSFDKTHWQERWHQLFDLILPRRDMPQEALAHNKIFVHPEIPGVNWDGGQQRPHHLCRQFAAMGFYTYLVTNSPPRVPGSYDHLQIIDSSSDLYLEQPVLYITHAYNYLQIGKYENPVIIYDVPDYSITNQPLDASLHKTTTASEDNYRTFHAKLIQRANVVITSSEASKNELLRDRPDVLLVPNGIFVEDFEGVFTRPTDVPVDRTIIGYCGALADNFDFDLLGYAAHQMSQAIFVLIGELSAKNKLRALMNSNPNILYLGEKSYPLLPAYLASFDIATIPYKTDPSQVISIPNYLAYLAAGKPTVTTILPEGVNTDSLLITESPEAYVNQLQAALALSKRVEHSTHLRAIAHQHSWEMRATTVLQALDRLHPTEHN